MAGNEKIPWKRISVEAAAIVASILLAFAIDAWWSARQLSVQEREILVQLRAEFEFNERMLDEHRRLQINIIAAATRLLEMTGPNEELGVDTKSIAQDMRIVTNWWISDPQSGVVSTIIQSGQLAIIRSDKLRNAVAGWPAIVQDTRDEELDVVAFTHGIFWEYITKKTSLRNIYTLPEIGDSRFSNDFQELFTDREFENHLHERVLGTKGILLHYDTAENHIQEILRLTNAQPKN